MKKTILAGMALGWLAMVAGMAWADAPVKKSAHLTRAQFQDMVKSRHAQKPKASREIGGSAKKGAPPVSPLVLKKNK